MEQTSPPQEGVPLTARMATSVYAKQCEQLGIRANAQVTAQLAFGPLTAIATKKIDCSCTFLGPNGVKAVLHFVDHHQGIEELDLRRNNIDTAAVELLACVVQRHHSIRRIDLSGNALSTPCARVLWDLAKNCDRVEHIDLRDTGIGEEWLRRIALQVEKNHEFQHVGYLPFGPPRPIFEWSTVLVGFIGDVEQAQRVSKFIVPLWNHLLAPCRARVSILVILEEDVQEMAVAEAKLAQCIDAHNYSLPWLIGVFRDGIVPPVAEHILRRVVLESKQEPTPPLRSKLGGQRPALHRCAPNAFIYFVTSPGSRKDRLDLSLQEKQTEALRAAVLASPNSRAAKVHDQSELDLQLSTDIHAAIQTSYAVDASQTPEAEHRSVAQMWNFCASREAAACASEVESLRNFVTRAAAGASFPMIVHGGEGLGRSNTLAGLCCALRRDRANRVTSSECSVPANTAAGENVPVKIVPFVASEAPSQSMVYFLWHLLDACGEEIVDKRLHLSRGVSSIEALMVAVHRCLSDYPVTAPSIVFVVFDLERLGEGVEHRHGPCLEWLPHSLPLNMRVIVSVATDCPALLSLRKRTPQPYEKLLSAQPAHVRVANIVNGLAARGVSAVGFDDNAADPASLYAERGVSLQVESPVQALLLKEEADLAVYCRLVPPLLQALEAHKCRCAAPDMINLILHRVPHTTEAAAQIIVNNVAAHHGREATIQTIAILLSARLPIPNVVEIAETFVGAKRFSTIPLLVSLQSNGIITFDTAGLIRMTHPKVARGVAALCGAPLVDRIAAVVARYLRQELASRSTVMGLAFVQLPDLLIRGGHETELQGLLLDPRLLDDVMQLEDMRVFVVDAFFKLLQFYDLQQELVAIGEDEEGGTTLGELGVAGPRLQFSHSVHRDFLASTVASIASCPKNIFQGALLAKPSNLLHQAALQSCPPPYPALVPRNHHRVVAPGLWSAQLSHPARHCHISREIICVSDCSGAVHLFALDGSSIATAEKIFAATELLGALICDDETVVCVGASELVLWNWQRNLRYAISNTTCSLHPCCINGDHGLLVTVSTTTQSVSIMHVGLRKALSTHASRAPVREARFCGNGLLVVSTYDIYLTPAGACDPIVLEHDGLVRAAAGSPDGQMVAAAVGSKMWAWNTSGDLMYISSAHSAPINDVSFHPGGTLIIASDQAQSIIVTASVSGHVLAQLKTGCGTSAAFATFTHNASKILARCGCVLRMWDGTTFEDHGALLAHDAAVSHVSLSQSMDNAGISVCADGLVKAWSLRAPFPPVGQLQLEAVSDNILRSSKVSDHTVISVTSNRLCTLCCTVVKPSTTSDRVQQNLVAQVWELGSGLMKRTFSGVKAATFCGDDRLICVENRSATMHNLSSNEPAPPEWSIPLIAEFDEDAEWSLEYYAPTNRLVAATTLERGSRIFCYSMDSSPKLLVQFLGPTRSLLCCFSSDDLVIAAAKDRSVRFFSVSSCAERAEYRHSLDITAACQFGAAGCLVCDTSGALIHITLPKGSTTFVAEEICALPLRFSHCTQLTSQLLGLVSEAGDIFVVDVDAQRILNSVSGLDTFCSISIARRQRHRDATEVNDPPLLFLGSLSGHARIFDLRLPVI